MLFVVLGECIGSCVCLFMNVIMCYSVVLVLQLFMVCIFVSLLEVYESNDDGRHNVLAPTFLSSIYGVLDSLIFYKYFITNNNDSQ